MHARQGSLGERHDAAAAYFSGGAAENSCEACPGDKVYLCFLLIVVNKRSIERRPFSTLRTLSISLELRPNSVYAPAGTLTLTLFPMEDSPLSIAANIAGLLTFAVAILASIYVRVVSLRNGKLELDTIRKSVEKNVNDLLEMVQETTPIPTPPFPPSPTFSGWDRRNSQDEEIDAVRLKKLSVSLSTTELIIYIYCWYAMDMHEAVKKASILRPVLSSLRDAEGRGGAYPGALLEILQMQVRILSIENIFQPFWNILPSHWAYPKKLLYASQRILTLGSSPTLIRWYRVREMVLEKVRHTDILRSQILSLQVSIATS